MKSDRWFYALFQQQPDLITTFLAQGAGATSSKAASDQESAGYRFQALELKAVSHRLDGVCWPPAGEQGTPEQPVLLLEVQMHSKSNFNHRLAAQSYRFLQQHPQVEYWRAVVLLPHRRLKLGPTIAVASFLAEVIWVDLSELLTRSDLNPLEELLSLAVRPKAQLLSSSRSLLQHSPQLTPAIATIILGRLPNFSLEEIMTQLGSPLDYLSHSRGFQELKALMRKQALEEIKQEVKQQGLEEGLGKGRQQGLEEGLGKGRQEGLEEGLGKGRQQGRQEGRQEGEASVALRQLARRCGPLTPATETSIRALPVERLELLADALLDFSGPDDLTAWLQQLG